MEIWGSLEKIEEESTKRKILSAKAKAKKYEKKMKGWLCYIIGFTN